MRQQQVTRTAGRAAARRRRAENDEPEIEAADLRDPDLGDDTDEALEAIDAALEAGP